LGPNKTYPIINNGNSFTGLSYRTITNTYFASKTTVIINWTSYTNNDVNDGLYFYNYVSYFEEPSLSILQFGNIPFTGQGQNCTFRSFAGEILAMDSPSLANANLSLCFYGSTVRNLVILLDGMFPVLPI
jgi:hypothetical protein